MDGISSVSAELREIYHQWECGYIESDQVCNALSSLGIDQPVGFMNMIHQRRHTRNLSFAMFIRSLNSKDSRATPDSHSRSVAEAADTQRLMHVITLKDIPVPPSAKAPFGTDNNIFIKRVNLSADSVIAQALKSSVPQPHKQYASVPGAIDVFQESCPDDTESIRSDPVEIPPHLKPSMYSAQSEPSDADYADFSYHRSTCSSRRMSENQSHILEGFVAEEPTGSSAGQRKHFERSVPKRDIFEWSFDPVSLTEDEINYTEKLRSNNILAHKPELPPIPYRPSSRILAKPSTCPFATDADNLAQLRAQLLKHPLGKTSPPAHAS